jgi:hypothetical protein
VKLVHNRQFTCFALAPHITHTHTPPPPQVRSIVHDIHLSLTCLPTPTGNSRGSRGAREGAQGGQAREGGQRAWEEGWTSKAVPNHERKRRRSRHEPLVKKKNSYSSALPTQTDIQTDNTHTHLHIFGYSQRGGARIGGQDGAKDE